MANYLLLRNNKESGPHSLDDLMELGLKPYDLVWVQGKSAAWRYPSEVEELRPFAPVVEEQPYDRFYKKQETEKKEEPIQEQVQVIAPEHEKYIPKKSVFVTMPGQKANPVKPAVKEEPYKAPAPAAVQQTIPVQKTQQTIPVQQTILVTENPVAAQVKYSQPLDEIKEMYVKTLHERKQKIARKGFWLQSLKKAAVILSLVAVGLIAGFIIKSNGNDQKEITQGTITQQTTKLAVSPSAGDLENVADANTTQLEKKESVAPPATENTNEADQKVKESPVLKQIIAQQQTAAAEKKETAPVLSQQETRSTAVAPGVETNPTTGERSRKLRTEGTTNPISSGSSEKKSFHSNDRLSGMVSVTSNEYKKVAFGGIRNLELTITNDSKYTLDNVLVELQYLKPSELPLKTENIEFKSVGPKATSTLRIPDTNRGIKVVYRIINIKSREMDELVSGN